MDIDDRYTLKSALMVYTNSAENKYYVETHQVKNGKLQAGKSISRAGLKSLIEAFQKEKKRNDFALLPSNLLAQSGDRLLWYVPASKHDMFFVESLNIPDGKGW